ncbi:hypothetical protein BDA96_01G324200 [Sorghum bicolor]|uniref:Uncharacterized protein n=2 Tax=Sorghum bicolor TaxID=4558 RepID=A0A921S190_SORBI|nr:hypothetical protein BDA96_01G324200 [Sorghum bicolor]KXG38929.1 hypothetical protein SORBI_3001G300000 [Sorghum bicolor]
MESCFGLSVRKDKFVIGTTLYQSCVYFRITWMASSIERICYVSLCFPSRGRVRGCSTLGWEEPLRRMCLLMLMVVSRHPGASWISTVSCYCAAMRGGSSCSSWYP